MLTFHKFIDFFWLIFALIEAKAVYSMMTGIRYADRMILLTDRMMTDQKQLACGLYRSITAELTHHNGCQWKTKCGWWVKLVCVALQLDS